MLGERHNATTNTLKDYLRVASESVRGTSSGGARMTSMSGGARQQFPEHRCPEGGDPYIEKVIGRDPITSDELSDIGPI